ncbi:MAG: hypothetical protein JO056_06265 [Alphaproteobacteria bacterium]|uniref:hypothetical protein n=1 Tax=Bradyrhizobium sp. TaxID=376 RepID=UPI001EC9B39B|nr:hypothetical protein [Bradyrhizobium sp.]MBV9570825.1 hypothetical protein [Alphaproteobacteria bacterium]MBV9979075.1 hypothetical protein [Bradyrhizobium sp.]
MLRSGYFDDFKGGPKLLFWGDRQDMQALAGAFRAASAGIGAVSLDSISEAVDQKSVVIQPATRPLGILPEDGEFRWILDRETIRQFAEMVDVLAAETGPGHQYLECGTPNEITAMVACDEYPANLNPKLHLDAAPG